MANLKNLSNLFSKREQNNKMTSAEAIKFLEKNKTSVANEAIIIIAETFGYEGPIAYTFEKDGNTLLGIDQDGVKAMYTMIIE
jgi:hypothetical protein